MTIETGMPADSELLGIFATVGDVPAASLFNRAKVAFVVDTQTLMWSNGSVWRTISAKRIETYDGTTDASGNFSVTFATPFSSVPHVNPVCYPPADSTTRVRNTAVSTTGFTVKTERNPSIDVLGIAVLQVGTANVPSTPVRVLVVES